MRIKECIDSEYEVILVANRHFDSSLIKSQDEVKVLKIFKYGYFDFPLRKPLQRARTWIGTKLRVDSYKSKLNARVLLFRLVKRRIILLLLSAISLISAVFIAIWEYDVVVLFLILFFFFVTSIFWSRFRSTIKKYVLEIESKFQGFMWTLFRFLLQTKSLFIARDLIRINKSQALNSSDTIFIASTNFYDLEGILRASKRLRDLARFLVVLRREPNDWGINDYGWRYLASKLEEQGIQITYYADTEMLREKFEQILGKRVETLPIPYGFVAKTGGASTYKLGYLGDVRDEKNFEKFVSLAQELSSKGKFKKFAQLNLADENDKVMRLWVEKAKDTNGVSYIEKPMPPQDYLGNLSKCENIFLAYDSSSYSARSSGVFVESIANASTPLVSNGSWMHFEITRMSALYHSKIWSQAKKVRLIDKKPVKFFNDGNSHYLIRLKSYRAEKARVKIALSTNLGITFETISWVDSSGYLFFPSPLFHPTEGEILLEFDSRYEGSVEIRKIPLTKSVWVGGFVDSNPSRLGLYFDRNQKVIKNLAVNNFIEYHSNQSIRDRLTQP